MQNSNDLPLKDIIILEFCQYLSGPAAGLRLADFGARVIKIEKINGGDACRKLAIKNLWVDESSLLFHTINRNKESFAADLKNEADIQKIKNLIAEADVIIHNFRPGVMEKLGLSYKKVVQINPKIIYATISGFGTEGPWKDKPGQDLLIQSLSGLVYTTGNQMDNPTPFGLAIADIMAGSHIVQGILAALIRRNITGKPALVEVNLMESILDFQFELLTTYFASGKLPKRSLLNNAHPLLSAPYGIYPTLDGFIAIAMTPIHKIAEIIDCPELNNFEESDAFKERDVIKLILSQFLKQETTEFWTAKLVPKDVWCMPVLDWKQMIEHEGYRSIKMEQSFVTKSGTSITTTRCPIRWNDNILSSEKPAPELGEHTDSLTNEFKLAKA